MLPGYGIRSYFQSTSWFRALRKQFRSYNFLPFSYLASEKISQHYSNWKVLHFCIQKALQDEKKKRERKERNIKQALWDIMKLSWYMPCLWVKTAIILLERGNSAIKGNFRVVLELGVYLHLDIIVSWALFAVNSPKHL